MATIDETGLILDDLSTFETAAREEIRNTIPEADLSKGADYDLLAHILAADSFQAEGPIVYALQQIFPRTSDTPYLNKHGDALKIPRPGAANAVGYAFFTGLLGSVQPLTSSCQTPAGIQYTTGLAFTIVRAAWANKTVVFYDPLFPNQIVLSDTTGMQAADTFLMAGAVYCIKEVISGSALLVYGKVLLDSNIVLVGQTVSAISGARVRIAAIEPGAAGNANFLDKITLDNPAAGITGEGVILECSGGADEASDEEYALLIGDVRAEYPAGGNRSQLLLWGKGYESDEKTIAIAGIARCVIYPAEGARGLGTADVYPQGIARARHLGAAKIAELQRYIAPAAPTEDFPGKAAPGADILVKDFTDLPVDVVVEVQGGPGYGPDWTGTFTVAAGGTVTRIPLTADPSGLIAPGNRVALHIGVNSDFTVATVDTVDPLGLNLTEALPAAPVAGIIVYPGSSLIEPVRDALLVMFDDLGPGDSSPPSRYPAPTTLYPANLDRALIIKTVRGVEGVNNLRLPSPAADVLPAKGVQAVPRLITVLHY